MPVSDNGTVAYVSKIISFLSPTSALNVGTGMGKFGFIFRKASEWCHMFEDNIDRVSKENWRCRLDGIEICARYITPLQEYLYDRIYVGPAEEIVSNLGRYDLVHLGDVIEHIEKSEGQRLLDILFARARLGVLVITRVGKYEQEPEKIPTRNTNLSGSLPTFVGFPTYGSVTLQNGTGSSLSAVRQTG